MPATGYTVASAATLLGAKPPKRREQEDMWYARMAAADQTNRENSPLQRMPEVQRVKRSEAEKKVRFTPSTMLEDGSAGSTSPGEGQATLQDDAGSDGIQAREVVTRAGTTGVAASFSSHAASGLSNTCRNAGAAKKAQNGAAGSLTARQDADSRGNPPALLQVAATPSASESKEARTPTQPSNSPALPFAHSHRLHANSTASHPTGRIRLDTSGRQHNGDDIGRTTSAAADTGYTASAAVSTSQPSSRGSRTDPSEDIFFTPIDVNRSTIEFEFFHAPMSTPRVQGSEDSFERGESSRSSHSHSPLLHRGGKDVRPQYHQASCYDDRSGRRAVPTKKEKITIRPEQLDRLIVALANAPLVQTHLRKQWLEDEKPEKRGNPSLLSLRSALRETEPTDSTPSLTNESTASDAESDSSSALDSRANSTFINERRPDFDGDEEDVGEFNEHHLARARPRARFGGIALVDKNVHGAPIRFISKGYKKGANVLQVGSCSFLNVPYGASVDCILRIEPGDVANGGAACSVTAQIMAQVLERRKARKNYLMVAEVDVTESLTKAVLVEFARHTGISLEDIEVVRPTPVRHDSFRESVDWCALADELQATTSTNEIIENTADSFARLDAESCTMQTLTLLSELERIKAQHVDFLVLRSTSTSHSNGMPTGITIPWISQHLHQHVHLWSPEASSLFREDLVVAVGKRHMDGEPFAVRVLWGRKRKIVRCVPLLEGDEGRTAGWVGFIGDEFDF